MIGTIANVAAIAAGSLVGIVLRRGIPDSVKDTVMQGLGLSVLLIGGQMALKTGNILLVIISMVAGGIIGQVINIEKYLAAVGNRLETRFGGEESKIARAFITSSLIYCVGAMAILGPIEDGLNGNPSILFVKSALDGISAVIFTSTMGIGVIFSVVPVFLYQGMITLLAGTFKELLNGEVIKELTAAGGLLIVGIGINILGLKEVRVGNLLPALVVIVVLVLVKQRYGIAI
ncbi:MAG: DUF554 domain-containing protein [Bacillota bacterium]